MPLQSLVNVHKPIEMSNPALKQLKSIYDKENHLNFISVICFKDREIWYREMSEGYRERERALKRNSPARIRRRVNNNASYEWKPCIEPESEKERENGEHGKIKRARRDFRPNKNGRRAYLRPYYFWC